MLADWWRVVLEDVPPEAAAAPKDGEDGEGIGTNGGGALAEDWSVATMPCTDRTIHTHRSLLHCPLREWHGVVHPSNSVRQDARPEEPQPSEGQPQDEDIRAKPCQAMVGNARPA